MSASTIAQRLRQATRERGALPVAGSCAAWTARWVAGPPLAPRPGRATFTYDGRQHLYTRHRYHYTWLNERAVEVSLAAHQLAQHDPARTAEIGNVMAHYQPVEHLVVDKYESAPGVLNHDVEDLEPGRELDLVLSVSTLEHVGFDEPERDADKLRRAVARVTSLLAPGGRLWATLPVGYNPPMDARLRAGELGFTRLTALMRTSSSNRWTQVDVDEVWGAAYDPLLFTAHGLVVAEAERPA